MSIIEVDKRKIPRIMGYQQKLSWDKKFKRNLYNSNYSRYYKTETQNPLLQQHKNQSSYEIIRQIKESKQKQLTSFQIRSEYHDTQKIQSFYSPYSSFIPLQDQSYLNDEIVNTFPFMLYLKQTANRKEIMIHYQKMKKFFHRGKSQGVQFVKKQWEAVKAMYLCGFDSVMAVKILIEIMRRNSGIIQLLYQKYGAPCLKEIFLHRIHKAMMYIRTSLKTHQNLKISVEVGDEINQKTLPMVMKTWYCAICMNYDCEKHKPDIKLADYQYHYQSSRNKISEQEHIKNIIKLLKFYENLKYQSDSSMHEQKKQASQCGEQCYKILEKKTIPKLYRNRHKLISPLAKSLLSLGIQLFSYKPCQISQLFQPKHSNQGIKCNQIFIHFTQQYDLQQLITNKMNSSEIEHLKNQTTKLLNVNIKIPTNAAKLKRMYYLQQRHKNQNPQFSVCVHCFVGQPDVDSKCEKCVCKERGFCLPACLCTDACSIPRIGCACKGLDSCQSDKCICYINKIQCQPGVCVSCFAGKHQKKNCCKNDQILRNATRKINIGISNIPGAGLGAFAGQAFNKNDLICKYTGQHISSDVDFIRQTMIKDLSFYNFDSPNGKIIAASIDARFMGNKARFINHGNEGEQNLKAENLFSNGTQYITLLAARDIAEGEELSFNYDGNGELYANHREKYPFIKPGRKN